MVDGDPGYCLPPAIHKFPSTNERFERAASPLQGVAPGENDTANRVSWLCRGMLGSHVLKSCTGLNGSVDRNHNHRYRTGNDRLPIGPRFRHGK